MKTGMKQLYLHRPKEPSKLTSIYRHAFKTATELYVVTAYLTDWNRRLRLNKNCKTFRLIIGKDFGITRKAACIKVRKWLPKKRRRSFLVASKIEGFHPKAVFWRDGDGKCHSIIGSSNLTKAAFETNYEANVYKTITKDEFDVAVEWIKKIKGKSRIVSDAWLKTYKEAKRANGSGGGGKGSGETGKDIKLPSIPSNDEIIKNRRNVRTNYQKIQSEFEQLFSDCASGKVKNAEFFKQLPKYWRVNKKGKPDTRVQGSGWARTGKRSDFRLLSKHFLRIVYAEDDERDGLVAEAIDVMKAKRVSARGSFFSEMLCLRFPKLYPILDQPMRDFIKANKLQAPKGLSEGEKYVDLARRMRAAVKRNRAHRAKNLLEMDGVIWRKYRRKGSGE